MSLLDKLKSMFSGGSSDSADDHSGHDQDRAGHDHSHEPAAPPLPQADVAEMPAEEETDSRSD
jgi:hypothetical protein